MGFGRGTRLFRLSLRGRSAKRCGVGQPHNPERRSDGRAQRTRSAKCSLISLLPLQPGRGFEGDRQVHARIAEDCALVGNTAQTQVDRRVLRRAAQPEDVGEQSKDRGARLDDKRREGLAAVIVRALGLEGCAGGSLRISGRVGRARRELTGQAWKMTVPGSEPFWSCDSGIMKGCAAAIALKFGLVVARASQ
jgi:hypothetical protein